MRYCDVGHKTMAPRLSMGLMMVSGSCFKLRMAARCGGLRLRLVRGWGMKLDLSEYQTLQMYWRRLGLSEIGGCQRLGCLKGCFVLWLFLNWYA